MEKSNVKIKSNIYILENPKEEIRFDNKFLNAITDFNAIEQLQKNNIVLTRIQRAIYAAASVKCVYADEGDFPNGTILENLNGHQFPQNVCRCHKMINGCCNPEACRRLRLKTKMK